MERNKREDGSAVVYFEMVMALTEDRFSKLGLRLEKVTFSFITCTFLEFFFFKIFSTAAVQQKSISF